MDYTACALCKRGCKVDRTRGERGFCGMGDSPVVARAALHYWEEPPISGDRGSGTVFFSGCSLGCIYCQNREISHGDGIEITEARLADIMLELEGGGAHNVNLVTPTHFVPSVIRAVKDARSRGLSVPVVYNTGSYDTVETIRALSETVDIFLPDFKYFREDSALRYSSATGYKENALEIIREMYRIVGRARFDENGIMTRGIIARILLLPGHTAEAKLALGALYREFGDEIYISLMGQYTPMPGMPAPLDRRVSHEEYRELLAYAERIGLKNGFTQELAAASESFIPPFDYTGVL